MPATRSFYFYRRVAGNDAVYGACTNQIELSEDRSRLHLRLASTAKFAVTLEWRGLFHLIEALSTGMRFGVACRHETEGPLTLAVEPEGNTMTLSLRVEGSPITVGFDPRQTTELVSHLRTGLRHIEATRPGRLL
ncbi:hypothetical protein [Actinoalloteichus spitiensis]|uniref:hypothetical protein n=1 Tax=Actinoalloteichus spitiensis TaxID=252394 RepID=UPI0012F6EB0A|nr:hypothetical protein [Actinoalloteichus spitiensis]